MSNTSQSVGKQLELSPKETSAPADRTDTQPFKPGIAGHAWTYDANYADRASQAMRDYANRAKRTDASRG